MSEVIQPDILHIEACNFIDKPMGGQLNFSRQLMKALGNRLALVGWANSSSEPIGRWFEKMIDGTMYRYFAIGHEGSSNVRPLVPARLTTWFQIKRYLPRILSIGIPNIIVREHAVLMAMSLTSKYNLCYYFPGVEAPLSISRYPLAKYFAKFFDQLFFQSLGREATRILAAADELAIEELKQSAGDNLRGKNIHSFPTRVDTDIYHPANSSSVRRRLGLPGDVIIATTTSRIHWAKGWPFLLEAFELFHNRFPKSLLVFVGDGVEREALERKAASLGLNSSVIVTGYQPPTSIASYIQSSDLFIMASLKEGWSTVLLEALACKVPIVTTRFSSADAIVRHGINGFVVDRHPEKFYEAMNEALRLVDVARYTDGVIDQYALKNLTKDLFKLWPLIKNDVNTQGVTL